MILMESPLRGAFVVEPERTVDERGWFARTFCAEQFLQHGLDPAVVQCSTSFNARKGTLRGMHYQAQPHGECKLVRCTRGSIYDVIVDLRPQSSTYLGWFAVELTAANVLGLYVPQGVAHGFITLEDSSEVCYQISTSFVPAAARGVRWNDPAFGIRWPETPVVMSERDRRHPDCTP